MKNNVHSQPVPQQVIETAEVAVDACLQAFTQYATPLTAEERRGMLKLGTATTRFAQTALKLAKDSPNLTSKSFDTDGFLKDLSDVDALTLLAAKLLKLLEIIEDIIMTAGSEAIHASLEFYTDVKIATERDVPGARAVYETLRDMYPTHNRPKRHNPPET